MQMSYYYENPEMLKEHTMPERAYYIPASVCMDTFAERRTDSDRMQLLNGKWRFRYLQDVHTAEEDFCRKDFDASGFDAVDVPGCWQMSGYDRHQYTNYRYPFPFDPPYVPYENPCGEYVCDFVYEKDARARRAYLIFEGVVSCFFVWVNGAYVGFGKVSHAMHEFDVTDYVSDGENRLAVLVLKWCDGSYLEDQDQFRMNGIFRDVYLLKRPDEAIFDYTIRTTVHEKTARVEIAIQYFGAYTDTKLTLRSREGTVIATATPDRENRALLTVPNPILWNQEMPYLYQMVLETANEVIVDYVGLRQVEIRDSVMYLNGKNIKLYGVNRHDSDPFAGYTISVSGMLRDLHLMKRHNIHAIRTSHYPNAPIFYQLCDRYGFLVMEEADLEAHGPMALYEPNADENQLSEQWNRYIADDPAWENAVLDRVKRMVIRDKNRACVVIWSMGNESAYGCNFEKALAWTKGYDKTRLTHYEGARYRNHQKQYDTSNLDLYSRMYPSIAEMDDYLSHAPDKPFILCEYAHAMGNGPGDLEAYFQKMEENDVFCGGFVWEWCDHAIACGTDANGDVRYLYGGDHGEILHDGNFCVDGLVDPNRQAHPGLLEYKNVNRPVRVVEYRQETGILVIKNMMQFTDLSERIYITYEVHCDGKTVETGQISSCSVAPRKTAAIKLSVAVPPCGQCYLKLSYHSKADGAFYPAGFCMGYEEILLHNMDGENQYVKQWLAAPVSDGSQSALRMEETDTEIRIAGERFVYRFGRATGMPVGMQIDGVEYMQGGMQLNIWRAPTDNDRSVREEWERAQYPHAYARAYRVEGKEEHGRVVVTADAALVAPSVQRIATVRMQWRIAMTGMMRVTICAEKDPAFPELPRFGIRMLLHRQFREAAYYGMGPTESYADLHTAACHGLYHAKVRDLCEAYIRPQESGSHYDCRYLSLTGKDGTLVVAGERPFSFHASPYMQETVTATAHRGELREANGTELCLDCRMRGIGSASCGPALPEAFRIAEDTIRWTFTMHAGSLLTL